MTEQLPTDPWSAPPEPRSNFRFLPAVFAAACLCLALLYLGLKHRRAAAPLAAGAHAGAAATAAPAAQPAAAPVMKPLGRSLAGITTRYKKMEPGLVVPIFSGPLEGGTIRKYTIESSTDDLYTLGGAVYRRVMSFRLAEMVVQVEGTHANFSGLVFIYALYPSAFDVQTPSGNVPPELQKLADTYGEKCGALAEPGARTAEHRETHDGYVFYCSNKDTTRLIYGVCSEGLLAAEQAAGK